MQEKKPCIAIISIAPV